MDSGMPLNCGLGLLKVGREAASGVIPPEFERRFDKAAQRCRRWRGLPDLEIGYLDRAELAKRALDALNHRAFEVEPFRLRARLGNGFLNDERRGAAGTE